MEYFVWTTHPVVLFGEYVLDCELSVIYNCEKGRPRKKERWWDILEEQFFMFVLLVGFNYKRSTIRYATLKVKQEWLIKFMNVERRFQRWILITLLLTYTPFYRDYFTFSDYLKGRRKRGKYVFYSLIRQGSVTMKV